MKIPSLNAHDWQLYYSGVVFIHPTKKTPHMITAIGSPMSDSTPSSVRMVELVKGKSVEHSLDRGQYKDLLDSKVFEEPKLGYRVLDKGEHAVYLTKIASGYQRGISTDRVAVKYDPMLASLHTANVRNVYYERIGEEAGFLKMIYEPDQMKVEEGIQAMLKGDRLAFSPSHEILFRPSVEHSGGYLADVLHRGQSIIARVDMKGVVVPLIDGAIVNKLIGGQGA